ncbi:MAG: FAD-dependent oxidoreductase [Alphaproteobacteria bacterium]|nr:FAD-dependent oxidoreductase [Alphaproteobacteria bacterium]
MIGRYDIAIVGAGMAGASLAAEIGGRASLLLIEAEAQPGYHSTGRSAAFWSESYGGPLVQPLTSASGPFLRTPPAAFYDRSFLNPRGAISLAEAGQEAVLDAMCRDFASSGVVLEWLDRAALEHRIPGLRPGWSKGLSEPSCTDIDVAALHGAYLRVARRQGAELIVDAAVTGIERCGDGWCLATRQGPVEADVIVNAAGAWADAVAAMAGLRPIGIQPYRRTIAQLRVDPPAPADLPLVIDALGHFYFKPEAGRLWLSPHDETPCPPCDAAAEDYDVALAIDSLERVVDWRIERVEHKWAGLRSFAPDRLPVYGYADEQPGFFWCAGQGGFGIQTAPAAGKLAAGLLLRVAPDPMVRHIDPSPYLAGRFAN